MAQIADLWDSTRLTALLTAAGYLLTLTLIPVVILRHREPMSALAWILGIILVPGLGGLLYLLIGTTRLEEKAQRKRVARETIPRDLPTLVPYELPAPAGDELSLTHRLMELACHVAETRPTEGNRAEVITDTNRAYGLQEQAIRAARRHIHLEYYIFQPDETGRRFRDLLIAKAREGVQVRFLFDAVGSIRLGARFLGPMRDAGVRAECFLPVSLLRRRWVFNLRNHRKILVVDGEIGFTGGVNVGNEYIGRESQFGYWRDTHMMLRGPAVLQLQRVFAADWLFAAGEELVDVEFYPAVDPAGDHVVQIMASGPDQRVEMIHELFVAAITSARRRVWLETSYFVPTEPLRMALHIAAHRGVEVRLILPHRSAHLTALLAAHSYYDELLASGVQIHEYRGGLLHSKLMTIDGEWSTVGSANFDNRSMRLNFEAGAVFYGPAMAERLEEIFGEDLARSEPLDRAAWARRSIAQRLLENSCRLLSPIL